MTQKRDVGCRDDGSLRGAVEETGQIGSEIGHEDFAASSALHHACAARCTTAPNSPSRRRSPRCWRGVGKISRASVEDKAVELPQRPRARASLSAGSAHRRLDAVDARRRRVGRSFEESAVPMAKPIKPAARGNQDRSTATPTSPAPFSASALHVTTESRAAA